MPDPSTEVNKPRPKSSFYWKSPGPGAYKLPPLTGRPNHAVTHWIRPEYTMRPRLEKYSKTPGPGVGKYCIDSGLKANGKWHAPEYTMRPKLEPKGRATTAGPGDYELPPIEVYRPSVPAYTFRQRTPFFLRNKSPAPNAYLLPPLLGPRVMSKNAYQECSMKGKVGLQLGKSMSPGPAAYDPIRPDKVKPKAPEFTMPTGKEFKVKWSPGCGPASYDPTRKIYPSRPAYTFGIRYPEYTANLYTECDKSHLVIEAKRDLPTGSETDCDF